LGPFVLTASLFPLLNRRTGTRIINVSSRRYSTAISNDGHKGLDLNNLNGELAYDGWGAYGNSKLATLLFAQELQRKVNVSGLDWLTINALHPGVVENTNIWRHTSGTTEILSSNNILNVQEGANTHVFLASCPSGTLQKGAYYNEQGKIPKLSDFAQDEHIAHDLWKISEEISGTIFAVR